jgi:hypothetical protein
MYFVQMEKIRPFQLIFCSVSFCRLVEVFVTEGVTRSKVLRIGPSVGHW